VGADSRTGDAASFGYGTIATVGKASLGSAPAAATWTLDVPTLKVSVPKAKRSPKKAATAVSPSVAPAAEAPAPRKQTTSPKDTSEKKDDGAFSSLAVSALTGPKTSSAKNDDAPGFDGSAVIEIASRYVGVPYKRGGSSPKGFDCSGFTQYVYGQLGIDLPHQSGGQPGKGRVVSRSDARPGDLIYTPGHVAIYAGGNKQIDASTPGTTIQFRKIWQRNPTFIRLIG